jgi:hypothetical protein
LFHYPKQASDVFLQSEWEGTGLITVARLRQHRGVNATTRCSKYFHYLRSLLVFACISRQRTRLTRVAVVIVIVAAVSVWKRYWISMKVRVCYLCKASQSEKIL